MNPPIETRHTLRHARLSAPGGLRLEQTLYREHAQALTQLGYKVLEDPDLDKDFGAVGGILRNDDGTLLAGADPREETTADAD